MNDITIREVLQKFLEVKNIRLSTQRNYTSLLERHLADWLDLPIKSITKDMVEVRHRELSESPTSRGTSGHGRANNVMKCLRALINSTNGSWHRIYPRQRIIPDRKLRVWYQAVSALKHEVARDFLIFLLLTDREHRLPLTEFLVALLRKRHVYYRASNWVFQSSRAQNKHLSGISGIVQRVNSISGIKFTCHDLRRTFLTMGEKLDVPHYTLKRLVNHTISNDVTGRYLVLDMERLRTHMSRITVAFLDLLGLPE